MNKELALQAVRRRKRHPKRVHIDIVRGEVDYRRLQLSNYPGIIWSDR